MIPEASPNVVVAPAHAPRVAAASCEEALRLAAMPRRLDVGAAATLILGLTPGWAAPYEGCRFLAPGETLHPGPDGVLRIEPPPVLPTQPMPIAVEEAARRLRTAVVEGVAVALRNARRLALPMSGGLDSTMLAVAVRDVWRREGRSMGDVRALHVTVPGSGSDLRYAQIAAHALGISLEEVVLDPETPLAGVEEVAARSDAPIWQGTYGPALFRAAREAGADTMLTGDSGDDALGAHAPSVRAWAASWARRLGRPLDLARGAKAAVRNRRWWAGVRDILPPALRERAGDARDALASPRPGLRGPASTRDRSLRSAAEAWNRVRDQAWQATFGVRTRRPFAETTVLEAVVGLPQALWRRGSPDRWLARKAFEGEVPSEVLWRPKSPLLIERGFRGPLLRHGGAWIDRCIQGSALYRSGILPASAARCLLERLHGGPLSGINHLLYAMALGLWCKARGIPA